MTSWTERPAASAPQQMPLQVRPLSRKELPLRLESQRLQLPHRLHLPILPQRWGNSDFCTAPKQLFAKLCVHASNAVGDRSFASMESRNTNARRAKGQVCARHTVIKKAGVSYVKMQVSRVVGTAFANIGGSAGGAVSLSANRRLKEEKSWSRFRGCRLFSIKKLQRRCGMLH